MHTYIDAYIHREFDARSWHVCGVLVLLFKKDTHSRHCLAEPAQTNIENDEANNVH